MSQSHRRIPWSARRRTLSEIVSAAPVTHVTHATEAENATETESVTGTESAPGTAAGIAAGIVTTILSPTPTPLRADRNASGNARKKPAQPLKKAAASADDDGDRDDVKQAMKDLDRFGFDHGDDSD